MIPTIDFQNQPGSSWEASCWWERVSMMKFYDLRKRLCEERDLTDLQCSGPGDDTVQITAFTRKIDPPPPSTSLTPSPFTRNTTGPLKLVMPKFDNNSLKTSHVAHSCDSSPTSDFDSDSDSGERAWQTGEQTFLSKLTQLFALHSGLESWGFYIITPGDTMRVGRSPELPRTSGQGRENPFFVKLGKKFDTSGICHVGIDTRISWVGKYVLWKHSSYHVRVKRDFFSLWPLVQSQGTKKKQRLLDTELSARLLLTWERQLATRSKLKEDQGMSGDYRISNNRLCVILGAVLITRGTVLMALALSLVQLSLFFVHPLACNCQHDLK